ncbi:MAG TPA: TetR/AcrR family transcriptional regulator [Frankiaceae bacterium]|jgi:AcrR family transcriptional regulator|nr:TetR/AcrR family transcriptional regulator [Frankiaceae bacterium]
MSTTPAAAMAARSGITQTRILDAAARCLGRSGVARLRMDDVAAEAGVSRTLVHRYFGSKSQLVQLVREHVVDDWTGAVDAAVARTDDPAEALATWFSVSLAYVQRRPILHVVFSEEAFAEAGPDASAAASERRMRNRINGFLEHGVADGSFPRDLDLAATAEALLQIHVGLMSAMVRQRPVAHVAAQRWTSAAVRILVSGLCREGAA